VSYDVLFRRGMRWWPPARTVLVAGGDWRLLWDLGDRGYVVVVNVVCDWFYLILDSLTVFQIR
jgi:hypothetical protein